MFVYLSNKIIIYKIYRYYWDLIMSFTFLYMFVAVPYIFSFQRVAKSSGPESWEPIYPACIICIFDIALNFITGISSRDSSENFLDPLLIIRSIVFTYFFLVGSILINAILRWLILYRRYVKGFFIIDFVSSVPYTWFYRNRISPPGHNGNSILLIPEFFLLLKICRICTLRLYVKHIIVVRKGNRNLTNCYERNVFNLFWARFYFSGFFILPCPRKDHLVSSSDGFNIPLV